MINEISSDPSKGFVAPSQKVISDVCEQEKFCKKQGPITFGQLKKLVQTAQNKNLAIDTSEGVYKATLRLLPWFFPQIAVAGFLGSAIRAFNKIIKPGLEDTRGYKSWWGRTLLGVMDIVEGDIPHKDPISKIFFISDGLLFMLDRKYKLKFARYISELASNKPDDEPVPEYFVENELRKWINEKFLINPPLPPKIDDSELSVEEKIDEGFKYRSFSPNVVSEELKWDFTKKNMNVLLLEKVEQTQLIRQIVRDIITIYKSDGDGEFYLPEDLRSDEMEYHSPKNSISVELILEMSDNVDDFMVTAYFVRNENVVEVKIVYNPKNKSKITYDLVGELNEIIAHELRHLYQRDTNLFDLGDDDEEELPPFEYYSQPEEIDAQVYGFRRMKKITKRPFEDLVRNWFRTHKEIHQLTEEEQYEIIKMILDYNSKI